MLSRQIFGLMFFEDHHQSWSAWEWVRWPRSWYWYGSKVSKTVWFARKPFSQGPSEIPIFLGGVSEITFLCGEMWWTFPTNVWPLAGSTVEQCCENLLCSAYTCSSRGHPNSTRDGRIRMFHWSKPTVGQQYWTTFLKWGIVHWAKLKPHFSHGLL